MERTATLEINGLLLVVVLIIVAAGLAHEQQLHAPLPPQAYQVEDDLLPGAARQTWFRVPTPVEEVRRFYQRALSSRGWHYCGTQATPHCTNLPGFGGKPAIDVYRRVADQNATGVTIEVWPIWDAVHHETVVKVYETTFPGNPPPLYE